MVKQSRCRKVWSRAQVACARLFASRVLLRCGRCAESGCRVVDSCLLSGCWRCRHDARSLLGRTLLPYVVLPVRALHICVYLAGPHPNPAKISCKGKSRVPGQPRQQQQKVSPQSGGGGSGGGGSGGGGGSPSAVAPPAWLTVPFAALFDAVGAARGTLPAHAVANHATRCSFSCCFSFNSAFRC